MVTYFLQEHEAHFCSKFKNKLRTIQPKQKDKVSNFQLHYVNKTAASAAQLISKVHFATTKKDNSLFNKLAYNSIFGYKLRTD